MAFDFSQIGPALPGMADGMMLTLKLLGMAVAGGVVLGTLLALARLSSQPVLSRLARYYVNIFRSIPLLDALKTLDQPLAEVHITNIHRREPLYTQSLVSLAATGVICGFGP